MAHHDPHLVLEIEVNCVMTEKPIRIQRKRTKGWRMPENTVYVGRPTKWGNPYVVRGGKGSIYEVVKDFGDGARMCVNYSKDKAQEQAVFYFKLQWKSHMATSLAGKWFDDYLAELCGKNLACWCPLNQPCHADVLLEIANK